MTDYLRQRIIEDNIEYVVVISPNGTKHWYFEDEPHRINGPAVEYLDGEKYWCFNGEYHRINGPAVEYYNGITDWYINGQYYPNEEDYWIKVLND